MSLFTDGKMNRRQLLASAGAAGGLAFAGRSVLAQPAQTGFTHGVASGDPLADRVILWTRYVPPGSSTGSTELVWEMALEETFSAIVASGKVKAGPKTDFTAKVDASGLAPATTYHFRFRAAAETGPVGRTRTLPHTGADSASMAVVSCSNYPQGYFHVYREIAGRDVDMVLHLGDYIYEYADGVYSNDDIVAKGRAVRPKNEIIAVEDYRTRYALYRSDPDLQAVHARHPFICVWDDHEIANDTWKGGAENHQEDEGEFAARKEAAVRAYNEWMPIRENPAGPDKINRSFNIGGLASLIMLDTRLCGRDKQLSYETDLPLRTLPFDFSDKENPVAVLDKDRLDALPDEAIRHVPVPFDLRGKKPAPMTDYAAIKALDPKNLPAGFSYLPDGDKFKKDILGAHDRTILGAEQEKWLADELEVSTTHNIPWQILGQQLLIGRVGVPMLSPDDMDFENSKYISEERFAAIRMLGSMGLPLNLDFWDGYPACRDRVYDTISAHANNAVFLSGDTHNAWCFNLTDKGDNNVAVEFGTPGVSSPGMEAYIPAAPERVSAELKAASPELAYFEGEKRGWMELSISKDEIATNWFFVSTVHETSYDVIEGPVARTKAGTHKVTVTA